MRVRERRRGLEFALIENMAREDLNPVEEARACAALVEELGLTREEVGLRVGRSRVAVSNLIRLLDLPDEALEHSSRASLREGHGRRPDCYRPRGARRRGRGPPRRLVGARAGVAGARGEPRADDAPAPRGEPHAHPDQRRPPATMADALSGALGCEVSVRPARGGAFRVQVTLDSAEQGMELARRLGWRRSPSG